MIQSESNFFAAKNDYFLLSENNFLTHLKDTQCKSFNIEILNNIKDLERFGPGDRLIKRFIEGKNEINFQINGVALDIEYIKCKDRKEVQKKIYGAFSRDDLLKALYNKVKTRD